MTSKEIRAKVFFNALKMVKAGLVNDKKTASKYISGIDSSYRFFVQHRGNENGGGIVYEIHEAGNGHGFFAEYRTLLLNLIIAMDCGFLPCVKYGEDYTYYDEGVEGNPFEYYFEPIGKEIELKNARNVIVSSLDYVHSVESEYSFDGSHYPQMLFSKLVEAEKKYIRIKQEHILRFEEDMLRIIGHSENDYSQVLGVHYRGTDFGVGYNLHPVQFGIEELIQTVKTALSTYKFTKIFLATDDKEVIPIFQDKLGQGTIIYNRDAYRTTGNVSVAFSKSNREYHHYNLGVEVLEDAYFLSRCGGFVGGLSQVAWGARLLKAGRDEQYCFSETIDKGINKNKRKFKVEI